MGMMEGELPSSCLLIHILMITHTHTHTCARRWRLLILVIIDTPGVHLKSVLKSGYYVGAPWRSQMCGSPMSRAPAMVVEPGLLSL